VVLGSAAAAQLGIDEVVPGERLWLGGQWFYVAGILSSAPLAPDIDRAVLVGFPAAMKYLGFDGHPTTVYVRSATDQVPVVQAMLA
jgi:putative ABC transport system permease protein